MYWEERRGITFMQFPALRKLEGIFHGIFLRFAAGGRDGTHPLNLGMNCGDAQEAVWDNRRRVNALLGGTHMVFARQVHGAAVAGWNGLAGGMDQDYTYLSADALASDVPCQSLFIQVADCQPVLLADPVRRVVANVHSGWRGSIANIVGRTVAFMQNTYGCRPDDILAGIGPSLGPCCAEFIHYRREIPSVFWPYKRTADHFDFWQISQDQLVAAGVPGGNISHSCMCTRCNQHLLFSHRGERSTGRFAAVIGMHPTTY